MLFPTFAHAYLNLVSMGAQAEAQVRHKGWPGLLLLLAPLVCWLGCADTAWPAAQSKMWRCGRMPFLARRLLDRAAGPAGAQYTPHNDFIMSNSLCSLVNELQTLMAEHRQRFLDVAAGGSTSRVQVRLGMARGHAACW